MMRYLNFVLIIAVLATVSGCAGVAAKVGGNTTDRRSAGTQVEDDTIETKAMERIQEKYKDAVQANITSYNRFVLITGQALSEELKNNTERIVYSVPNVKKIANEMFVGALATSSSRRTDSGITSDIRYALNKNKSITGTIKITTDRGVVYLLGLVTHAEANAASEIASTTTGVQKVVRVFEYID